MQLSKAEKTRFGKEPLPHDVPIEKAVARWLSNLPHLRRCRLPNAADAFDLTEFGLRTRLSRRDHSYQDLLDIERMKRLDKLLEELPEANGTQAAKVTGFSNGDVFRTWYKRQHGVTWKRRGEV